MKENEFPFDERQLEGGLKRLIEDLKKLNTSSSEITERDQNSISLIVDEAIKGVDIRTHYPAFYERLLQSLALREQFIESVEDLRAPAESVEPFPARHTDLAFLHAQEKGSAHTASDWKVTLERSAEQLMAIFFAPQLNYRAGESLTDPAFVLLRSEFLLDKTTYSVIVESRLHEERDDALALSINVAASSGDFQPLQASLHWGGYSTAVVINAEGRTQIEDLPIASVFNETQDQITEDLQLTLKTAA